MKMKSLLSKTVIILRRLWRVEVILILMNLGIHYWGMNNAIGHLTHGEKRHYIMYYSLEPMTILDYRSILNVIMIIFIAIIIVKIKEDGKEMFLSKLLASFLLVFLSCIISIALVGSMYFNNIEAFRNYDPFLILTESIVIESMFYLALLYIFISIRSIKEIVICIGAYVGWLIFYLNVEKLGSVGIDILNFIYKIQFVNEHYLDFELYIAISLKSIMIINGCLIIFSLVLNIFKEWCVPIKK